MRESSKSRSLQRMKDSGLRLRRRQRSSNSNWQRNRRSIGCRRLLRSKRPSDFLRRSKTKRQRSTGWSS